MDMAIRYDPQGRQFAMVLDGEVIGFARTAHDATRTLQAVVRECAVSTAPPSILAEREDTLPTPQQEADDDPTNHTP